MLLFLIIGLTLSVFLMALLGLRKGKTRADYILTIWMGQLTIQLLVFYLLFNGFLYQYPKVLVAFSAIPLLHGVLVYFYTLEVTGRFNLKPGVIFLHFIPFIVLSLLSIPFYLVSDERQFEIVNGDFSGFQWYMLTKLVFFVISGLTYSTISIIEVRKYRKRITHYLSNTDNVQLRWLEFLSAGLGVIWIVVLFLDDRFISIMVTIFVISIAFFSISQLPVLYSNQMAIPDSDSGEKNNFKKDKPETEKYAKSGLDTENLNQIIHKVENFMATEKAYKNPELTLKELSEKTGIPGHQLSQAFNNLLGKTFYHYVNNLRLEEFLKIAQEPENQNYTYLSLAFDAGFNSKTTFNKYFKLTTGQTPSQFFSTYQ